MSYDASEMGLVNEVFKAMLARATGDGGAKRARGEKPPWWRDPAHEAAIFSHLNKWKHGEVVDPDSGAHTLVHLAWRALAIAYQETYGKVDPAPEWMRRVLGLLPDGVIEMRSNDTCVRIDCPNFGGKLPCPPPTLDVGNGPRPMRASEYLEKVTGATTPGHPDYLGGAPDPVDGNPIVLVGPRTGG